MSSMRKGTLAMVAAALLAGCAGTPNGQDGAGSGRAPAGPALPPRPYAIPIDTIDVCATLTKEQLDQLDVANGSFQPADDIGGRFCTWRHSPDEPIESYLVLVDRPGIEAVLGNVRGVTPTSVGGFPAVEAQSELGSTENQCGIVVDIADGEVLQLNYNYNGSTVPMTRELACEKARPAAEMMMQTVIDLYGRG